MKTLLVCLMAISLLAGMTAFAQDMPQNTKRDNAVTAPLKNIKGSVKADGDKLMFVADKDQKSWDVMNPEALKGHEGHHVEVNAHVYADKGAIHVMGVKMLKSKSM